MIIFTIHTIQPAKSKQISSLRGLHARSNPSSCIRLLHSPDKSEQAVRNDERRRRNDVTIYFQNTLLTKIFSAASWRMFSQGGRMFYIY